MMITGLPSVFEVVTGSVKKQPKASNGSSKNKSGSNVSYMSSTVHSLFLAHIYCFLMIHFPSITVIQTTRIT
jgi:hypothetical protein